MHYIVYPSPMALSGFYRSFDMGWNWHDITQHLLGPEGWVHGVISLILVVLVGSGTRLYRWMRQASREAYARFSASAKKTEGVRKQFYNERRAIAERNKEDRNLMIAEANHLELSGRIVSMFGLLLWFTPILIEAHLPARLAMLAIGFYAAVNGLRYRDAATQLGQPAVDSLGLSDAPLLLTNAEVRRARTRASTMGDSSNTVS